MSAPPSPPAPSRSPVDDEEVFIPRSPASLAEAGVSETIVEQLILKNLYFRGEVVGRELGNMTGFQFSVIEPVIDNLKQKRLLLVKRSSSIGSVSASFVLAEEGRSRAKEFLENNQHLGPAPITLKTYVDAVERQKIKVGWATLNKLRAALKGMVISDDYLQRIGPAMNSFRSMLIYGKPGNGKSFLAEHLVYLESDPIYIPHVVETDGQFIKVFDSLYHVRVDDPQSSVALTHEPLYDQRWVKCKRPFLTSGGELTLDMLDLIYIPTAKIYDAPYQMKANNGMYLIDDFGRQQVTPTELLNRWIYPLDRGKDYLRFRTGTKIQVPFGCFLIFSSNMNPEELGDEAFLRRLEYKLFMRNPPEDEFVQIFREYCKEIKLKYSEDLPAYILQKHYGPNGRKLRRCHPRDVLRIALDLIRFQGRPPTLTRALIDEAYDLKFVTTAYDEE